MVKKLLVSIAFLVILGQVVYPQVISRSNLEVQLLAHVVALDTIFMYEFEIVNDVTSQQRLDVLRVEVGDDEQDRGGSMRNFIDPENWSGWTSDVVGQPIDPTATGTLVWVASDSIANLAFLTIPPRSSILPGNSIRASFQSKGLPSIKRFWARGWSPPITEQDYDSLIAIGFTKNDIVRPWYEDAFQGITIAPQLPTQTFVATDFLETLMSYKHQAIELGWIDNQGIANSLDAKLNNVKKQLERGKIKTAKNVLRAFLNEVEAQKEKYLSSEAYALLKFNGEFLLGKL